MSLEGIPGMSRTFIMFVHQVRVFLRDYPELNRLVRGVESSDRQIAWAVMDAVEDFNGTPHFTEYTLEQLLGKHQGHLLTRMTAINLIESVGLLQTRNHINYSDGGLNVGANDKTGLLMNWLQLFKNETEQKKTRAKVGMNIEDAMDSYGVASEYWATNATYAAY